MTGRGGRPVINPRDLTEVFDGILSLGQVLRRCVGTRCLPGQCGRIGADRAVQRLLEVPRGSGEEVVRDASKVEGEPVPPV